MSEDEILEGAVNRARRAFEIGGADLGVGLEGGLAECSYGPVLKGWAAVFDGKHIYVGSSPGITVPAHLLSKVNDGMELAHVMEEATGRKDVRSNEGAFGVLTGDRITRHDSFKLALYCAFAPLMNKEFYYPLP